MKSELKRRKRNRILTQCLVAVNDRWYTQYQTHAIAHSILYTIFTHPLHWFSLKTKVELSESIGNTAEPHEAYDAFLPTQRMSSAGFEKNHSIAWHDAHNKTDVKCAKAQILHDPMRGDRMDRYE